MKLTKLQLKKIITEELEEALGSTYSKFETRPVILPMSDAPKGGVKGSDWATSHWLHAYAGEAWDQISQDRSEKWRAGQAFQQAASQMLYDLAQGYTKRLQDGEWAEAPPVSASPPEDEMDF